MKADDRFMVLLTAVVLIVAVGTMAQKSDTIMAAFGSVDDYEAIEDAYTIRAGRTQTLDVLANDLNVADGDASRILILQQPVCGTARRADGQIEFLNSDACDGRVTFTYCVIQGDACPSAQVVLTVSAPESMPNRGNNTAVAGATGFPTLRAPALNAPNSNVGLSAADATASLRNRDFAPAQIGRPSQVAGVGLGRQESAGVSAGMVSSGFGGTVVDEGSLPTLSRGSAPERVAIARPNAPQLGSGSRVFAPAPPRPQGSTPGTQRLAGLGQPSAPARPSLGGSNSGLSASSAPSRPAIGGSTRPSIGARSQPSLGGLEVPSGGDAVASAAPSAGSPTVAQPRLGVADTSRERFAVAGLSSDNSEQGSRMGLSLRTVTSMFRPAEGVSTDTASLSAQASARPQVTSLPELSATTGVVTERAAQIILPVNTAVEAERSTQRPSAPITPNLLAMADITLPRRPTIAGPSTRVASLSDRNVSVPRVNENPVSSAASACEVLLEPAAQLGEMVALSVMSECRPDALVTISYSGASIDLMTDATGMLQVDLPAFDEVTEIIATFADGAVGSTEITVRGMDRIARVAIAWQGGVNLDLHAFEYGAAENGDGHVWEGNPRSYRDSRRRGGGYITQLGLADGRQLEVYTLPVSRRTELGVVDTSLRVNPNTGACADRVNVISIFNNQSLAAEQKFVSIETAGCQGEALAFDAAIEDIDIASR